MPDRQAASFVCAHAAPYGMLRRGLQDGWPDVTGVSDAAGSPTPGHSAPGPFREDNCNIAILRFAAYIGPSSQPPLAAENNYGRCPKITCWASRGGDRKRGG